MIDDLIYIARARRTYIKRCRCGERLRAIAGAVESSSTLWSGDI
jgi:hypothetical protein